MALPSTGEQAQTPPAARLVGSALKCLALLDLLAEHDEPMAVSKIATETGVRRGTVHQQMQTLVAAGWVEQLPDARYRLTLRSLVVGNRALEQADLGSRVLPPLTELATETGESASLAVLDHGEAMIVQQVSPPRALRVHFRPGSVMPLRLSASGRVIVAYASAAERAAIAGARIELPDDQEIAQVRADGYARQRDEYLEGMASIAVPVVGTKLGTVAVALTSPSSRFEVDRLLEPLRTAQATIGRLLGA